MTALPGPSQRNSVRCGTRRPTPRPAYGYRYRYACPAPQQLLAELSDSVATLYSTIPAHHNTEDIIHFWGAVAERHFAVTGIRREARTLYLMMNTAMDAPGTATGTWFRVAVVAGICPVPVSQRVVRTNYCSGEGGLHGPGDDPPRAGAS